MVTVSGIFRAFVVALTAGTLATAQYGSYNSRSYYDDDVFDARGGTWDERPSSSFLRSATPGQQSLEDFSTREILDELYARFPNVAQGQAKRYINDDALEERGPGQSTEAKPRRVYVAYYARDWEKADPESQFHTGILITPVLDKNKNAPDKTSLLYHATNSNPTNTWEPIKPWPMRARTEKLVSVLFLGTVDDDRMPGVDTVLKAIPVDNQTKGWKCRHWTRAAIKVLGDASVGKAGNAEQIWRAGFEAAVVAKGRMDGKRPLETCDAKGALINGEIGPYM